LPVQGIGWYRRKLSIAASDVGKSIYLDIDGALSYAMVWLNGNLVGGWPYGYNSFRLDLTPYLQAGDNNQLAIRLDNPTDSARWYPGGGLYRNVWLTAVDPTHVAQWGTFLSTREVSSQSAVVDLTVQIENKAVASRQIDIVTNIYAADALSRSVSETIASFSRTTINVRAHAIARRTPKRTRDYPSPKPTLHRFFSHKLLFFFFNYCASNGRLRLRLRNLKYPLSVRS
jgi:beta-galactosidase